MKTNSQILQRRQEAVPRGVASATSIFVEKAANAELWDVEGKRYLDFAAGIAVCNTGHCNPQVMSAVAQQSENFVHTAFQVVPYETYVSLAERINRLAPITDAKTIFMTTGAEAVENAVKIARNHTGRSAVISFSGAFHGRSLLTMGMTGKVVPYKVGFGPFPADIYHVPFPTEPYGVTVEDSLAAIEKLFKADVEPSRVAAIIVEPVQGEGGFYVAPKELLRALRDICDQHGIMLIVDEVQTGFARTGRVFATEYFDIEPDLMTIAKALGGGYPISGVLGKAEIMDSPEPGGLGGTYGGSPIACAAAHAVLDLIKEQNLCEKSQVMGARMQERLREMKEKVSVPIGDIRGLGAMVAFELIKDLQGHEPDAEKVKALVAAALKNGLILLSCGIYGNTIRLLAPLTIPEEQLEEGLNLLEKSLLEL